MSEVKLRSRILARGLERPAEKILAMHHDYASARARFREAANDVVTNVPNLAIMIRSTDLTITLPMGGWIVFGVWDRIDIRKWRGLVVQTLWTDDLSPNVAAEVQAILGPRVRPLIKPVYTGDESGVK